jgi:uncharacterized damage-inducible protein DinB
MSYSTQEAEFLKKRLILQMKEEDARLLKVAESVPTDKLGWKPATEKSKPFGELAYHAAAAGHFFCDVLDGREPKDPALTPKTREELIAGIRKLQGEFAGKLADYSAAQLAKDYDFFGTLYPGIELMHFHHIHLIHHRGQLTTYLRAMGAKVPSIYGPSADDGGM